MRPVTAMCQCRLSVLTEALQGKSRWLRKAPLELSHPDRPVFEGQQTVLLFAAGSAAKEQWFVALSAAISAEESAGSSVHALYNTFCDYVREHALVEYPEVDPRTCETQRDKSQSCFVTINALQSHESCSCSAQIEEITGFSLHSMVCVG